MNYGSVCSGIEAATVAWHPLGWRASLYAEIEPFPCAVLNHYYQDVPNHGDMTKFKEWPDAAIDVLVGGTPCQSFSVAGLRKGLDDPRGNLTLTYLAVAAKYRPKWMVWENVPGVLSDATGAFGSFLGGLGQLGYGFAYRVLDAQYFRVPQRRRRVFVVGCAGDWRAAAAVLFERHSLQGHPAPRREAGKGIALPITSRVDRGGEHREAHGNNLIANPLPGHHPRADLDNDTYIPHIGFAQNQRDELRAVAVAGALAAEPGMKQQTYIAFSAKDHGADALENCSPTLRAGGHTGSHANAGVMPAVAFGQQNSARQGASASITPTLDKSKVPGVGYGMQVRRLTPRECERLQGFPDDYTLVPYRRGKHAADGPRYKALGNSMAVPVMRWIGERITAVEAIT